MIKNDCNYDIVFNHEAVGIGETKIFTAESHSQGLVSPDCYNGKAVFNMTAESEAE